MAHELQVGLRHCPARTSATRSRFPRSSPTEKSRATPAHGPTPPRGSPG